MTEEAKQAKKDAKRAAMLANLTAPRAGTFPIGTKPPEPEPTAASKGLELSDLMYKPLDWFTEDPENAADFEKAKNARPGYWTDLQRDIEQNGILTPLLATPDGSLLQGHSRLTIARRLGLARVPVQIIDGGLPTDPQERARELRNRRRLDNLLRFELDDAARLAMLADIWPDFYTQPGAKGRPTKKTDHRDTFIDQEEKRDTVSLFNSDTAQSDHRDTIADQEEKTDHRDTITAATIAKATGKSVPTVKRDRQTTIRAGEIAISKGRTNITAEDIKQAKEEQKAAKAARAKPKAKAPSAAVTACIEQIISDIAKHKREFTGLELGIEICLSALNKAGILPDETRGEINTQLEGRL